MSNDRPIDTPQRSDLAKRAVVATCPMGAATAPECLRWYPRVCPGLCGPFTVQNARRIRTERRQVLACLEGDDAD